MTDEYNIIVEGVGGQGVLTLAGIIAYAAFKDGYDVKTSEIHGLSQRYGSVPVHIRMGRNVRSPTVLEGTANLIIGVEPMEGLKGGVYGDPNTTLVILDRHGIVPISSYLDRKEYPEMEKMYGFLKKFAREIVVVDASEAALRIANDRMMSNMYLLGFAVGKGGIPVSKARLVEAIKSVVRQRFWASNIALFEKGIEDASSDQVLGQVKASYGM